MPGLEALLALSPLLGCYLCPLITLQVLLSLQQALLSVDLILIVLDMNIKLKEISTVTCLLGSNAFVQRGFDSQPKGSLALKALKIRSETGVKRRHRNQDSTPRLYNLTLYSSFNIAQLYLITRQQNTWKKSPKFTLCEKCHDLIGLK